VDSPRKSIIVDLAHRFSLKPKASSPMSFDPIRDYPLGSRRPDLVSTLGGTPLAEVTLDAVRAGLISSRDARATPETLRRQAAVASAAGREPLAESLERAAELALVSDGELLEIYTSLRPGRSTAAELESWAVRLDGYAAVRTAAFVREAAAVYEQRGLLARA
jgi:propanediol dehydratase small subunit